MKFQTLPRVFGDQPLYGAAKGPFTFIISEDEPEGFTASVKVKGATPFDGSRHDLGGYCAHNSLNAAKQACEKFYRERNA